MEDQISDGQDLEKLVQHSLKPYADSYAIDPFILSQSVLSRYFLGGSPFLRLIQREGRCLYMKEAIQQWFAQGKDEFSMAEVLFNGGHYRGACFHAQQSVEKALKGPVEYFMFIGHRYFRTATDISERECSKKHGLSLTEGFVQQGRSRFDARSVLSVRERERRKAPRLRARRSGERATVPVRAISAKPGNAAGGFFQHSL